MNKGLLNLEKLDHTVAEIYLGHVNFVVWNSRGQDLCTYKVMFIIEIHHINCNSDRIKLENMTCSKMRLVLVTLSMLLQVNVISRTCDLPCKEGYQMS